MNSSARQHLHKAPSRWAPLTEPLYYLQNFRWLLEWVSGRHGALLLPTEAAVIDTFASLPTKSQGLLVRMVMRKGELFRADKLHYRELGSIENALAPLIELGWVERSPVLELEDLFRLFTWTELRLMLDQPLKRAGITGSRKGAALEALAQLALTPADLVGWGASSGYVSSCEVLRLTLMPLCDRLRVMFFGNAHQDWSEFVLTELGLYEYEPVEFNEQSRPFTTRAEVDAYLQLSACRERFYAVDRSDPAALAQVLENVPVLPTVNPWLVRSRDRLLFNIAREWERAGALLQAADLYRQCGFPGARARTVRVLELQEKVEQALQLAQAAQASPESEAERQVLQRVVPRLRRKLGLPKLSAPRYATGTEQLHLSLARSLPVELAVKQHLESDVGPVYYVENSLITGLFGLLCWEALFAPLPGAFFHPFQAAPADLHWPDFHDRRKKLFDICLNKLNDESYREVILTNFNSKHGRQSPFVQWALLTRDLLEHALTCIPPDQLRQIFERLLLDLKANRAGLPDLVQFWPAERRYRFIEVKAPGDKLQDNQKLWLEFFAVHQVPAYVCHVQWQVDQP